MPRQMHGVVMKEGMIMPTKIRKRGCSSSSSSSSKIRNYRLNKRAILVGKSRAGSRIGLGRSRSSTPAPSWRTTILKNAVESPEYSQSGRSTQPVSARRLAAALWEMNGMPSPKMSENELQQKKREKMQSGWKLHSGSDSLPPHLSAPWHSPSVSEDQSAAASQFWAPISERLISARNAAVFDSISNASFMETETRSRAQSSSRSVSCGERNRLKDVSNALTTSKELLKIINRIWSQANPPSSSLSVISALHAELERARLQVNQLIKEQYSNKSDINYLLKCFAEEKAKWKIKEHRAVEDAIKSLAGELDAERKLRRRVESMNKKLGNELAEIKSSFIKTVKDLESEKRAREITEQVCGELARDIDEDRDDVGNLKNQPINEILELEEKTSDERAHKHQPEGKNSAIGKLRKQLEVFLGTKKNKDEKRVLYLNKSNLNFRQNELESDKEAEDAIDSKEESPESDIHSIDLGTTNVDKSSKRLYKSAAVHDETRGRNSISAQISRRSTSLLRTASEGAEWSNEVTTRPNLSDGLGRERLHVPETPRRSHFEEARISYKPVKDHILLNSRLSSARNCHSPLQQKDHSRDPCGVLLEKHNATQPTSSRSRMGEAKGETQSTRRSKW